MKKKWIIPAIIAVVLVAIALFIAAYPFLLFVAATDESIKQLNNSYINSDYQGWHEVTFSDKHHFSLPDTWRIEAIDDTTYCIYAEDAQVIAYVGNSADMRGWIRFDMRPLEQQNSLRCRNYLSGYISAMAAICTR